MAENHLKESVMKFTPGFVMNSLFCFCVRRLSVAGLGMTVLGLCVAFAYAETDAHIESVATSPRGTFRIEQERKRDAGKGEWTTTAWITLATDPNQRSQLDEPFGDENGRHFFISPDEQWICATVHEHSQLQSLVLYQRKKGLQFDQVAAEQEEEGNGWHFDTNDRFAPKGDVEQDETGGCITTSSRGVQTPRTFWWKGAANWRLRRMAKIYGAAITSTSVFVGASSNIPNTF
jgi:hypothetical protein